MVKKYLLIICGILPVLLCGQANSWINYSQKYYKIKVAKDGIYRVDSTTLAKAGIPLSSVDPRNFQLFFHGQEQYIYVRGQSDGVFNGSKGDYIEFYGQHNTGALINDAASDSLLYTCVNPVPNNPITAVPNPYYSMFNDTSTYFLTWGSSPSAYRMAIAANDTSFSLSTPYPFFMAHSIYTDNSNFCAGARSMVGAGEAINDPRYTATVGWFYPTINMGSYQQIILVNNPLYVYKNTGAPDAYVKTFFEGQSIWSPVDHEISISPSWPSANYDTIFEGFVPITKTYTIPGNQLLGNVSIKFISKLPPSTSTPSNLTAVSYVYFQYAHTPNLEGGTNYMMYVKDTTGNLKTYFSLNNLLTKDTVRVYDLTGHNRYMVTQNGASYKVLVPNSGNTKQCYITSDGYVNMVTKLTPAGTNGTGEFTPYTKAYKSPYIIITHPSLWTEASAYANYRYAHNHYQVILANVEELYDQFCYGIEKDPMAIRNFCSYIISECPPANSPIGLFLIGKGIHSNLYRQDSANYNATLVPSFGSPSSDILLTAGLNPKFTGPALEPVIPTGRLAAVTNTDVSNYLDKVMTYESNTPALWMKNVVHFAGGASADEQKNLYDCLSDPGYSDATIAEDTSFGARVYTFQKTTAAPIQVTLSDSVTNLINNGVSLMTFFGHASGNNFDINLDAPSNYNNVGKYPMILAMACFSGDIFQPVGAAVSSTSEQFVLNSKGSIGFIAMDDVAEENHLCAYSHRLYTDFCSTMYRQPIGRCMQDAAFNQQSDWDNLADYMCLEMQLHGDPAIAINGNDSLPDFAVNDSSVSFIPANVTTQLDSFKLQLTVDNLAKAINKPVTVEIDRVFPDDSIKTYTRTFTNIYNRATLYITLPVDKVNGPGLNEFTVKVDPNDQIPHEITKANNNLKNVPLLISSGDIIPVYPYEFAIIPKDTATLKASTGDPFASAHNYMFQIDTTIYFNSPFLKTQMINAKGGVVRASWKNWINTPIKPPVFPNTLGSPGPIHFKDSTVYYWRVRRDTLDMKHYPYEVSSFQYIKGKSGWGQSHYFQFDNNQYSYLQQTMKKRIWSFDSAGKTLLVNDYGNPNGDNTKAYATAYYLDFNIGAYGGCQYVPGLYVAIIDSASLIPWSTQNHNLGADNNASSGCNFPDGKFIYWYNDANAMKGLEKALIDSVPNGDYIIVYSWMEAMFRSWADSTGLQNELIKLGANKMNILNARDSVPFIFFVKKGNLSTAVTKIGTHSQDTLNYTVNLKNNQYYGSMLTPLIGPAQKWDSISWRQHSLLKTSYDSVRMNVNVIDKSGNASTLMKGVSPAVANMYITSINAKQYPYLQLSLFTKDAVTHTPSQMNKWQVFYTPVPEVAVNPSIYTSFYADNLSNGDTVRFKTVVQNIGDYPMDSMLVNAWIVNANNAAHYIPVKKTKKLNPGDTTMISVKYSTYGYNGNNSIWMEVNPENNTLTRPEQYHFNNYVKRSFVAQVDKNNPLLDVTFDGVHILNNDIVSPHPNILIQVTSDNKNLPLDKNDTGNIAIYIRNINSTVAQRLYLSSPSSPIQFTPASLPDNKCKILYSPTLADGTYELSVQAADRSNNISGTNPYKIDFEVITKSAITNVFNYPNPFSTATRFVFTLTGEQLPTYFKIQVITITGKVVREITEAELGPLHIGRNITEYAWDGTDQFGSKLANGIYLYRVITSINGEAIDNMATTKTADSYFTKGWGKMYLIR